MVRGDVADDREPHPCAPVTAAGRISTRERLEDGLLLLRRKARAIVLHGKLAEAAKAYDEAAVTAGKAGEAPAVRALALRARLYAGLTRTELGDKGAEAAVAAVADEPSAPETLRGLAMLSLANLAVARGDSAEAAKWLNAMDRRLRPDNVWQQDKAFLVRSEPSLTAAPAAK